MWGRGCSFKREYQCFTNKNEGAGSDGGEEAPPCQGWASLSGPRGPSTGTSLRCSGPCWLARTSCPCHRWKPPPTSPSRSPAPIAVPVGGLHRVQELLLAAALMGTGVGALDRLCEHGEWPWVNLLLLPLLQLLWDHLIPGLLEKAHGWWWWWPCSQVTSVSSEFHWPLHCLFQTWLSKGEEAGWSPGSILSSEKSGMGTMRCLPWGLAGLHAPECPGCRRAVRGGSALWEVVTRLEASIWGRNSRILWKYQETSTYPALGEHLLLLWRGLVFLVSLPYGTCCYVLVPRSCPTLCDAMDCSPPGSSVHGIFQARILEWVAIPFSRASSQPRNGTWVSCTAGWFFTIWATREALCCLGLTNCPEPSQDS